MKRQGLIQIYTGDGKGKTTAAFGQALRAAGQGLRVFIIQFMKSEGESGEQAALKGNPLIQLEAFGRKGWVTRDRPDPEDKKCAQKGLARALEILEEGRVDLLILDEVNVVVAYGLLRIEEVLDFFDRRPTGVELVLTGREVHPRILERADLATEMKQIKHPAEKGVKARRGIEY